MQDLIRAKVQHNELQRWLDWGKESLMLCAEKKNIALLLRFNKQSGVSYLYAFSPLWHNTVSWDDTPKFAGVYASGQRLFLTEDALSDFMEHWTEPLTENQPYMSDEISGEINGYIEGIVQNNRNSLSITELASSVNISSCQSYAEYGAAQDAINMLLNNQKPDTQFHSGYTMQRRLDESSFLTYLSDAEGYVQSQADQYLADHQEQFLMQFLEKDALNAAYRELIEDTAHPIHKMKAIADAVNSSGAKTVNVTVEKDGQRLTFKTEANSLRGYQSYYSTYHIPAQDRQKFEQLFGKHENYTVDDITRITYGRNTIYEAAPRQEESMADKMGMGGMSM